MNLYERLLEVGAGGSRRVPKLDSTVISGRKKETYKLIQSGNHFEIYKVEVPFYTGNNKIYSYEESFQRDRKEEYRNRNTVRAKNHIRRLVNCNFGSKAKFVTLTFRDTNLFDIKDIRNCHLQFRNFIRRLRFSFPDLHYICVVEFQDKLKRGAVHFHMICDLPFVSNNNLAGWWSFGFVRINEIYNKEMVGSYVSKYLLKNAFDERFRGFRRYYCSNNLITYISMYGNRVGILLSRLLKVEGVIVFKQNYNSVFNGRVDYYDFFLGGG